MATWSKIFVSALILLSTSGCAYFTNYTRSVDLQQRSYALDVKQRVVFSQEREVAGPPGLPTVRKRVICAEPSPDALTVISASAGVGAANAISAGVNRSNESDSSNGNSSSNQNVNVTAALAEQGAFVGLRTQSIQLLRDTMYRLCEGYASGAISDDEFTAMQRRYQSTMMGLLAIEQLTRPVVAAQVVLASNAAAQSGASAGDAAVDKAQTRLDEKAADELQARVDLEKARSDERTSRKALEENLAQANAARAKAERETTGDTAAKKAAGDAAAKPFEDARNDLQSTHMSNIQKTQAADMRASSAAASRAAAERDLQLAKGKAAASAGGNGQMGAIREASSQMTADLTAGVKEIVMEINKSYMRDSCFSLMASLVTRSLTGSQSREAQLSNLATETCLDILRNEEARMKLQLDLDKQRLEQERISREKALEGEVALRKQRLEADTQRLELEVKYRQLLLEAENRRTKAPAQK